MSRIRAAGVFTQYLGSAESAEGKAFAMATSTPYALCPSISSHLVVNAERRMSRAGAGSPAATMHGLSEAANMWTLFGHENSGSLIEVSREEDRTEVDQW